MSNPSNLSKFALSNSHLDKLEQIISIEDRAAKQISSWSVYLQVEHVLLVNSSISEMISKGVEPEEIKNRTLLSYLVFAFGYIPRGKGKAPEHVLPCRISQIELINCIKKLREQYLEISKLDTLNSKLIVGNHPFFGALNRKQWLRFMEIHTNHHLKIINDIEST